MLTDLIQLVRVKKEVNRLVGEVEMLEESLYKTAGEVWDKVMSEKVRVSIAQVLNKNLPRDIEGKKKSLREIKEWLLSLPEVKVTVAIELTDALIEEMSYLLRKSIDAGIIIDIERDSMIAGGAIVSFQGKYFDYSLATKMDNVWAKNADILIKKTYG